MQPPRTNALAMPSWSRSFLACSAKSDQVSFSTRPPEAPDSRRSYATTRKKSDSVSRGRMPFQTPAVVHFSSVASKPPGASMSRAGPEPRVT